MDDEILTLMTNREKFLHQTQPIIIYLWGFDFYQRSSSEQAVGLYIRKEGQQSIIAMRQLHNVPHVWPISCHVTTLPWQEPEEELNKRLLMNISDRDRNVKSK